MRFRCIVLVAATTLGLSLLPAPGNAAADADSPGPDPAAVEDSVPLDWLPEDGLLDVPLDGAAESESVTAAQSFPSPSLCRGKSNDPHQSTTPSSYGWIKGYSETYCVANVPYIEVRATVWRKRWWGYQHVGQDGSGHTSNWYRIGRSGTYRGCQNNTWRTVGYHVVRDIDLQYYSLETQNYQTISCW
jgi:hypothetical protein